MKAMEGPENITKTNINNDNINFSQNISPLNSGQINNENEILSNNKPNPRKQSTDSNQENIKKTFLKEFGIKEKKNY